jgi:septum formation protein
MAKLFGDKFSTASPDIDEKAVRHPGDPKQLPLHVARAKMDAMKTRVTEPSIIVTADQIVLFNGEVREKPTDEKQAREFLASYSNQSCETVSALVVHNSASKQTAEAVHIASVKFLAIGEDVVDRVVNRGEIFQSAGGFRVEDTDLKPLVGELIGGYDSVLGLPGPTLLQLLAEVGYSVSEADLSRLPQFGCSSKAQDAASEEAPAGGGAETAGAGGGGGAGGGAGAGAAGGRVGARRSPRAHQPKSGSLK